MDSDKSQKTEAQKALDAALFAAIDSDDTDAVKAALVAGADLTATDFVQRTPFFAAKSKKIALVLIEAHYRKDPEFITSPEIEFALFSNLIKQTDLIDLKNKIDPKTHPTPPMIPKPSPISPIVDTMNDNDTQEKTERQAVAEVEGVVHVLEPTTIPTPNTPVDTIERTEMQPVDLELFEAIDANNIERIRAALKKGADVDAHHHERQGRTPLMCVKSKAAAELLLKNGANVNAQDDHENTALMWTVKGYHLTVYNGHQVEDYRARLEVFQTLLSQPNLDVNAVDIYDNSAIDHVIRTQSWHMTEALFSRGAHVTEGKMFEFELLQPRESREAFKLQMQEAQKNKVAFPMLKTPWEEVEKARTYVKKAGRLTRGLAVFANFFGIKTKYYKAQALIKKHTEENAKQTAWLENAVAEHTNINLHESTNHRAILEQHNAAMLERSRAAETARRALKDKIMQEIGNIQKSISPLQEQMQKLKTERQAVSAAAIALQALEKKLKMPKDLTDLKRIKASIQIEAGKIKNIQKNIIRIQEQREELQKQLHAQITQLPTDMPELQEAAAHLKAQLIDLESEMPEFQKEVGRNKVQITSIQDSIDVRDAIEDLRSEASGITTQIKEAQSTIKTLKKDLESILSASKDLGEADLIQAIQKDLEIIKHIELLSTTSGEQLTSIISKLSPEHAQTNEAEIRALKEIVVKINKDVQGISDHLPTHDFNTHKSISIQRARTASQERKKHDVQEQLEVLQSGPPYTPNRTMQQTQEQEQTKSSPSPSSRSSSITGCLEWVRRTFKNK